MADLRHIKEEAAKKYTILNRSAVEDERLSWEAKGLHTYLVSRPPDWKVRLADLLKRGGAGKAKLYRILRELKEYGYLAVEPIQGDGGKMSGKEYQVFDLPNYRKSDIREIDQLNNNKRSTKEHKRERESTRALNSLDLRERLMPAFLTEVWPYWIEARVRHQRGVRSIDPSALEKSAGVDLLKETGENVELIQGMIDIYLASNRRYYQERNWGFLLFKDDFTTIPSPPSEKPAPDTTKITDLKIALQNASRKELLEWQRSKPEKKED